MINCSTDCEADRRSAVGHPLVRPRRERMWCGCRQGQSPANLQCDNGHGLSSFLSFVLSLSWQMRKFFDERSARKTPTVFVSHLVFV